MYWEPGSPQSTTVGFTYLGPFQLTRSEGRGRSLRSLTELLAQGLTTSRPQPRSEGRATGRGLRQSAEHSERSECAIAGSEAGNSGEQCVDEVVGVELDEVQWTFAEADEFDRNIELLLHGHDDAALG